MGPMTSFFPRHGRPGILTCCGIAPWWWICVRVSCAHRFAARAGRWRCFTRTWLVKVAIWPWGDMMIVTSTLIFLATSKKDRHVFPQCYRVVEDEICFISLGFPLLYLFWGCGSPFPHIVVELSDGWCFHLNHALYCRISMGGSGNGDPPRP